MNLEETLCRIERLPFGDEKTLLTENMFHISVWKYLNTGQIVRLLQLLENNLSYLQGRKPSKISAWLKLPTMANASYRTNSIKVSEWHIENGLSYLRSMNAQMYCAIIHEHEHEHIDQYLDADSAKTDEKTEEYRVNLKSIIPYSDVFLTNYVQYRFQPIEYYAHEKSESKTISTFKRLNEEFGSDFGFEDWHNAVSTASVDILTGLYNEENCINFSFNELYSHIFHALSNKPNIR